MSTILANIEKEDVTLRNDGIIRYRSKAAIDGDGRGASHGDPDFQRDTSLHHHGAALNADEVPYIAVPPAIIAGVTGIILGSQAYVYYQDRVCAAVVGDIGPHSKLGEISIACAKALGIPWSPTKGGITEHEVDYEIHPGKPAVVNGVTYHLQSWR